MTDEQVLRAQKWVNSNYGGVAGYVACPENGVSGWGTMNSLVMALQHELGISPVVASFGPTTYAKLDALGDIGFEWDKNRNLVAVLEFGLWCKGYWAVEPGSEGWFTGVTRDAVEKLRSNMGIGGPGVITAKIAKAILNMDAYVVVAGGTDKIRGIQQWLNQNYWTRSAASIGPCDGIYSRDVQKALMIALQYELGISSPNGNFGPGTQAALRNVSLSEGSSGTLVSLFTAACVFNEPVPIGNGVRTTFKSSWDAKTTEYVKLFQEFSYIPQTGRADYTTWAQLLVSMGDPDRAVTGSDTRFVISSARAKWLYDNGYRIVGRYLYHPDPSYEKQIQPGELETILANKLKVFPIFQVHGRDVSEYKYEIGYQHALKAHEMAEGFGINRGTTIYFAVDYDTTQEEIDGHVIQYFQGVASGLASRGKKYVHGVYGSRNVCINVTNKTYARYSFVSGMSWGFSGNLGFPLPSNWSFNQIKETGGISIPGSDPIDLDNDVWRPNSDPGVSSLNRDASPASDFISLIAGLYAAAVDYKASHSTDRSASKLVMEFMRHKTYGGVQWQALIGDYDHDFVSYASGKGFSVLPEFTDPVSGYRIGAEHMLATADGHYVVDQPGNPKSVNVGDITGWGGDLMTFYTDWRNSEEQYASGRAFCEAKLAKPGVSSSFGFTDLIEDADGYLVARAVRGGKDIATAVRERYSNGGTALKRFTDYFGGRWGSAGDCKQAAWNVLTATDPIFDLARNYFITLDGAMYPNVMINLPGGSDKLDSFVQGFTDALLARVGAE
ncbi:glycoside hydrolase domain-containing protein [Streptomyces sp. NPDC048566]|uniref:glycoside hydrolase domain-containing protein n=1 Tax=Streptomyces sp. NPDC048566 TaxID=3365569 RepID=UPI00371EDC56